MSEQIAVDVNDMLEVYKAQRNAASDTVGVLSAQVSALRREIGKLTAAAVESAEKAKAREKEQNDTIARQGAEILRLEGLLPAVVEPADAA